MNSLIVYVNYQAQMAKKKKDFFSVLCPAKLNIFVLVRQNKASEDGMLSSGN